MGKHTRMGVYYQITPLPLCYSKLTLNLAKIWRRLFFHYGTDTLNHFKIFRIMTRTSKAVFLADKNRHLISIQPFPQQSHWTKPSGNATMYGVSLLITELLSEGVRCLHILKLELRVQIVVGSLYNSKYQLGC